MTMRYQITHTTRYRYHESVTLCHNRVQLEPLNRPDQRCLDFKLQVRPEPALMVPNIDFFGNRSHYFEIHHPHAELEITAISQVERCPSGPMGQIPPSPGWETVQDQIASGQGEPETRLHRVYAFPSLLVPTLPWPDELGVKPFLPGRPLLEAVMDLTCRIHDRFAYSPGATSVATPLLEVMTKRQGVCQDFAHVAIGVLRGLGLYGRYVSGYLETRPPPGQPRLQGVDASHAWFETFVPGQGWYAFDPTNAMMPHDQHVVVAVGRDYADVPPVKGVLVGGREHVLEVSVDVSPLALAGQEAILDVSDSSPVRLK